MISSGSRSGVLPGSDLGHSFIVVGQNPLGQWLVVDNTDPNHVAGSGGGPIIVSEHTFDTSNKLYGQILDAKKAYVSRLTPVAQLAVAFASATFTSPTNVALAGTASDYVGVAGVEIFNGTTDLGAATLNAATGAGVFRPRLREGPIPPSAQSRRTRPATAPPQPVASQT